MNDSAQATGILELVRDNLDLTLSDLLNLLRQRVETSTFQLANIADIDTSAFNKIIKGREGRLLHHDEIENLINGLTHPTSPSFPQIPDEEADLWRMALQSAAAADNNIASIRRFNQAAGEIQIQHGRRLIAKTMRQLWLDTSGALPMAGETQTKIALSWLNSPRDLDLHVQIATAEREHVIHYAEMGNLENNPWAELDRDVQNGFGPETITIKHWLSGEYRCAVSNYSGECNLASCGATIVLDTNGPQQTFHCPAEGDGGWWLVFVVDTNKGNIEVINKIVHQPWRSFKSITRIPS